MCECSHADTHTQEFWRYMPVVPVAQQAEAKKSLEPRKEPTSQRYLTDLQIHAHTYFLCKKAVSK